MDAKYPPGRDQLGEFKRFTFTMGKIIWLASYPKSGNTWVRVFLANFLSGEDKPYDINELANFCPTFIGRPVFDAVAGRSTRDLSEREILKLRDAVQRMFCVGSPGHVFIKTHSRFGLKQGLPLIAKDCTAGAIYIVRNPLDVAVSAAAHFGVSIETMVRRMTSPGFGTKPSDKLVAGYIGSWSHHVESWTTLAQLNTHLVRYEDLYADPRTEFARVVKYLNLPADPQRLDRAIRYSDFQSLTVQEKHSGFTERPPSASAFFRHGRPGQGRTALSPSLIDAIVSAFGEQMARLGYAVIALMGVFLQAPEAMFPGA